MTTQPTPDPAHQTRLDAGQACLDAALNVYLPLALAVTWLCDPHHVGVGRTHAKACHDPGKAPMHPWKAFQTRLPTVEEVQAVFNGYPIGNVGCVLGQASRLVRIDEDGATGRAVLEEWSGGDLPPTWTFRSGSGGRGLLYGWPQDVPCKTTAHQKKKADHQELRLMGNGSQTVLPPSRHESGALYTWEPGLSPQDLAPAPAPAWLVERLRVVPRKAPARRDPSTHATPDAARVHHALDAIPNADAAYDDWLKIGMALHSTQAPWARDAWDAWSQQSGKYDAGKQDKAWHSFQAEGGVTLGSLFQMAQAQGWQPLQDAQQRQNGSTPPAPEKDPPLPYSDYTNALAFVRDHGQDLRYCYAWKSWLVWSATHWQRDDMGQVHQLAKQTVKRLARHAEHLEDEHAKALMAHIKKSLSKSSLDAMVRTAQDEPGIPVKPDALDTDAWALNCANGTVDLRTGDRRAHRQEDLLTKCLPIAYDPEAPCPAWLTFLEHIMQGNAELIVFLQRALGYSLTGSTQEQCFFLLHGPTKTGKSTFMHIAKALLGPYGTQAEMSTFLHKDRPEVRNDLADLAGMRLVAAIETDEGKRLAEALIKQLTGGTDTIKARFLFEEYFEYRPQFKVFLATNHKPKVNPSDDAIWERIRLIPFLVQIPKDARDKQLETKLRAELPGILAWAVRGCLAWSQTDSLSEPRAVVQATQGYRDEMDTLAHFLEECCATNIPEVAKVKASVLASAYQTWCKRTGELPLANLALIKALEERGYTRQRGHANQYYWHGFGLINTEDEADE